MKKLSDAAERALRHRQWHWCRRPNGFSAMARWKTVAARIGMPAFQVIAFVNWLEELANAADTRGHVGDFMAADCAVDLGMAEEEAARIFAALEDGERPWIADSFVADFHDRNPDREDPTVNERKRRSRARTDVLKKLALLAGRGLIDVTRRLQIEVRLRDMSDSELFDLQAELSHRLSTVTRDARTVTRDIVTVTPEQSTGFTLRPVDNFADGASGAVAGPSDERAGLAPGEANELWLGTEGVRIIAERMFEDKDAAMRRMLRWRDQQLGGDASRLIEIIRGADRADYVGPRFHNLIVDGIKAAQREGAPQRELPIVAPLASERKLG